MTAPKSAEAITLYSLSIEPRGIVLDVNEGETIMGCAERLGYRWPTLCHGEGSCSICWVEVTVGGEHLSAVRDRERETLETLSAHTRSTRPVRLACQAHVRGDVTVRKPGVRPNATEDRSRQDAVPSPAKAPQSCVGLSTQGIVTDST